MNMWDYVFRWEVGVFLVLLIFFTFIHAKYGFMKKFFSETKEEANTRKNRFYFSFLVFAICFIAVLIYEYLGNLFRNFEGNMKVVVLLIVLIVYFLGALLWLLFTSHREYDKEGAAFGLILIISYILFNYPNDLAGRLMVIVLGFSFIVLPFYLKKDWKIKNLYPWITLLLMLAVFLFGIMVIDEIYGEKTSDKISLYLNIDGNTSNRYAKNGTIECVNEARTEIFVESNVSCEIKPPAKTNFANVTFISLVGNLEKVSIDDLEFSIPYELLKLGFELNITDTSNVSYHVTTVDNYDKKIITKERDTSNEEKFILALLALMGIIFFSVPAMMNSFKELNS